MICFCITNKNRTQHLKLTLPQNLKDNEGIDCKFVILDYNSQDDLYEYIHTNYENDERVILYSYVEDVPFRMAHAKNMCHRLGILEGGDILCNLDSDNYTGKGFANYISKRMRPNMYLWSKMKHGILTRGISGRIVVDADAFIKVGGYNEKYENWSPDDKDFNARLQRIGYIGSEIDDKYLNAVTHNDKMRFKEYKHIQGNTGNLVSEDDFDISEDINTIANFGNIGLGTVYKSFEPIELNKIPTRIFGIGLHKTATTSLHTALQILGYDSAHWKNAHWAKAIWKEVNNLGRSLTIEQHYAICDLPIPLLYKDLDLMYPCSKFILTIRDENKWIKSIEKHWNPEFNKNRKNWNKDPFTHFIHKQIYGQINFDQEIFLEKYRQHNAEVINYFSSRDDLLVFKNDNWENLCTFLDRPIPDLPYPNMNET